MVASAITMGSRGTLVVPKSIRKALGYSDGCLLLLEVDSGSLRIRKAVAMPVDEYTKERAAQLILNASVDAEADGVVLVEWGDVVAGTFGDHLLIELTTDLEHDDQRDVRITGVGRSWAQRWARLDEALARYAC